MCLKPPRILLTSQGGEPLVREDLTEVMKYAKSIRLRTLLNTRGTFLENQLEVLNYTDVAILGIDSLNPDKIAKITNQTQSYAKNSLWALEKLMQRGLPMVISAVAIPEYLDETQELLTFACKHKIPFQLSPQLVGRTVHPQLMNNPQYYELIQKVIESKKKGLPILGVMPYLEKLSRFDPFTCYPQLMPTVRPDGILYHPCLELGKSKINLLEFATYRAAIQSCKASSNCTDQCHIFCHMALSLLQIHPILALREGRVIHHA